MSDEVLFEKHDGIAIIAINRPQAKNAVNRAVAEAVAVALDAFETASDVRVGIPTGTGGTFCAGMDLKGFVKGESPPYRGARIRGPDGGPAEEAADCGCGRLCARLRGKARAGVARALTGLYGGRKPGADRGRR